MPSADVQPRELVPLAPLSTLGVGGPARHFLEVDSAEALAAAHAWAGARGVSFFVLGGGSNLVISDDGIDALVVRIVIPGITFTRSGAITTARCGAGEIWDDFVARTVERGLAGLECLSGIPGTVGGTPIQNVGAYGQEVAQTIERVTVFDTHDAVVTTIDAADCGFHYRMSRFKQEDAGRFVVCDVTFRLADRLSPPAYPDLAAELDRRGITSPSVSEVRDAVLTVRRRKGMVIDSVDPDTRSVGSFFMNPVLPADDVARVAEAAGAPPPAFAVGAGRSKIPAAWLIERAGFHRGFGDGPVGISSKHTLALVTRGGATARDVLSLAVRIKRAVADAFGVLLRPEPVFVGFGTDDDLDYLRS